MEILELKPTICNIKLNWRGWIVESGWWNVLISYDCGNKLPQTRCFKITETYSVIYLKVSIKDSIKKSKVNCWQGFITSEGSREEFALCVFQLLVAVSQEALKLLPLWLHCLLFLYQISLCLTLVRTVVTGFRARQITQA